MKTDHGTKPKIVIDLCAGEQFEPNEISDPDGDIIDATARQEGTVDFTRVNEYTIRITIKRGTRLRVAKRLLGKLVAVLHGEQGRRILALGVDRQHDHAEIQADGSIRFSHLAAQVRELLAARERGQ